MALWRSAHGNILRVIPSKQLKQRHRRIETYARLTLSKYSAKSDAEMVVSSMISIPSSRFKVFPVIDHLYFPTAEWLVRFDEEQAGAAKKLKSKIAKKYTRFGRVRAADINDRDAASMIRNLTVQVEVPLQLVLGSNRADQDIGGAEAPGTAVYPVTLDSKTLRVRNFADHLGVKEMEYFFRDFEMGGHPAVAKLIDVASEPIIARFSSEAEAQRAFMKREGSFCGPSRVMLVPYK